MAIYNDRVPYTYVIGWSTNNVWYYSVKWAEGCHPDTFWIDYFTSSREVERYVAEHGPPDVRRITNRFTSPDRAVRAETRALRKIKASGYWDRWLNRAINGRVIGKHTEESRLKMSLAHLGKKRKPFSEQHKERLSEAKIGRKRAPFSEETKRRMREAQQKRRSKVVDHVHERAQPVVDEVLE